MTVEPELKVRPPRRPFSKSIYRILTTTHHAEIGLLYIGTAYVFLIAGGLMAVTMRWELATPEGNLVNPDFYASLFTVHGTAMIFLWASPVFLGFINYLLPKMIGAPDMYYPRLNALSFWLLPVAGMLLLLGWPNVGWTGYTPLSVNMPGAGVDMWILSLHLIGTSGILGSLNFIVTTLRLRRPGITFANMPLFVWAALVTAFIIIFAVPVLAFALTLLLLDRNFGTHFYLPQSGGEPILWQHLFWFFGHPEVYILAVPALGIVSELIPRLVRKPIYGYRAIAYSSVLIGILGYGVWVHHMFTTGLSITAMVPFMLMTMAVAIPSGVKVVNWEVTLFGSSIRFNTPTLFTLSTIASFIAGGVTGVFQAAIPVDFHLQDTYWVVGHMHLILFGLISQAAFAATYYYFPYFTNRMYSETLGKVHFAVTTIGQYLVFFSMLALGLQGMPRRYFGYQAEFQPLHIVATFGAILIGIGTIVFMTNLLLSWRKGPEAKPDPWDVAKIGMPDFMGEAIDSAETKHS